MPCLVLRDCFCPISKTPSSLQHLSPWGKVGAKTMSGQSQSLQCSPRTGAQWVLLNIFRQSGAQSTGSVALSRRANGLAVCGAHWVGKGWHGLLSLITSLIPVLRRQTCRSLTLKPTWSKQQVPRQPGIHRETLSKNKPTSKKDSSRAGRCLSS